MLKVIATCVAASVLVATHANGQAKPFGVREGTTLDDLTAIAGPLSVQEAMPPSFYLAKVPKPHPDLNVYAAVVGDSTGVCQVVGGKVVDAGTGAEQLYNSLKSQLERKYGAPSATDKSQVRWMAVSDAKIPKNLESIALSQATQQSGGVLVTVRYRFTNVGRCQAPAPAPDPVNDAL